MTKTKTGTKTKTTPKKKMGRPPSKNPQRHAIHTYLTTEEKAHIMKGMELDGVREFAVFLRKCAMDRATAIITARHSGMKIL